MPLNFIFTVLTLLIVCFTFQISIKYNLAILYLIFIYLVLCVLVGKQCVHVSMYVPICASVVQTVEISKF